jgi:hypothetical protein
MSSLRFYVVVFFLTALSTAIGVFTIIPSLRETVREWTLGGERTILGKVAGDLSGKNDNVIVIKVKTSDSLSLEIYSQGSEKGEATFQKRIVLPERRDGYFTFHGRDTNLVMADIDHDGRLEILAPTFDENLIPRLNVYKYEPGSQSFSRMSPDDLTL